MHYHSTCLACIGQLAESEYQDSQPLGVGEYSVSPGGVAFTRETEANEDAAYENAASYMKHFGQHRQVVLPCQSRFCRPQKSLHRLY